VLAARSRAGTHLQIARPPSEAARTAGVSFAGKLATTKKTNKTTAYNRGWALYPEASARKWGSTRTLYMRLRALTGGEMLRACRLVVDTRALHCEGRTGSARRQSSTCGQRPRMNDRHEWRPSRSLHRQPRPGRLGLQDLSRLAASGECVPRRKPHSASASTSARSPTRCFDDGPLPLPVLRARIDEWIRPRRSRVRKPSGFTGVHRPLVFARQAGVRLNRFP